MFQFWFLFPYFHLPYFTPAEVKIICVWFCKLRPRGLPLIHFVVREVSRPGVWRPYVHSRDVGVFTLCPSVTWLLREGGSGCQYSSYCVSAHGAERAACRACTFSWLQTTPPTPTPPQHHRTHTHKYTLLRAFVTILPYFSHEWRPIKWLSLLFSGVQPSPSLHRALRLCTFLFFHVFFLSRVDSFNP